MEVETKAGLRKNILIVVLFVIVILNLHLNSKDIEFPLVQSFAYYPYEENNTLSKGQFDMNFNLYQSNIFTFNFKDNIMNDFGMSSVVFGTRYGLINNLTIELYIRYMAITGGFLDGFIENFHRFFGLPNAYRPDYPRDIVNYYNNDYFVYKNRTGNMSPLVISLLSELMTGDYYELKGRIGIGIPVKSKPGISSDKLFLSTGLIFTYEYDSLTIDLATYLSWFKNPKWFEDVELRSKVFFAEIRIKYKKFLTGFIFKNSPLIYSESGRNAYQIQLGFIINKHLEFLFLEDFAPFDTTPDVSFNLRIKL